MGLEIFLVIFDYFSIGILGDVSVRKSNLVEYSAAVVFFGIPSSYDAIERAVAKEVALDREVNKRLGDEAA